MTGAPSHDDIVMDKNKRALQYIEDVTINADEIQEKVLAEILSSNAHAEYLQRFGLDGRTDRDTFKKVVPVVSYEDLKPDIDRIANGDTSPILCSKPILQLISSSGTSGGKPKWLPITEEQLEQRSLMYSLLMPVMNQFVPGLDKGKTMYFLFINPETKTPGGLICQPVSTCYYKSSHFKDRFGRDPYANYTSTIETILCLDSYQSTYSQLLLGLCQNEQVFRVGAHSGAGFIRIIKFLEKHWFQLCNDIRMGSIDSKITDQSIRESVMKVLKPNPRLASYIEAECKKDSWKGIITRIWPNTKCIDAIVVAMDPYIPMLDYYSNGLPIVCNRFNASECFLGLNLNPLSEPNEVCYTLIPTMAYFEFLPHNGINGDTISNYEPKQQDLVDLVDVKLGHEYELVVTTHGGLYRYQVGDIFRVAGFKNKAPQFKFVCRKNVVLSIDNIKTDEAELQKAVNNGANLLLQFDASLIEYTSRTDMSVSPSHYVLYWEIRVSEKSQIPGSVFEECCVAVEESLNFWYRHWRVVESIGPLEIKVVENGTFDKLMNFVISRGTSPNQYKTPRCVKHGPIIELLDSKTLFSYFSPRCPIVNSSTQGGAPMIEKNN